MKKLILSVAIFTLAMTVLAEEKQEVVQLPKMNKKQIYDRSLLFVAQTIPKIKGEFNYKNYDEGKISGNIETHSLRFTDTWYFRNSVTIEVKDGRARISVIPLTQKVCTYLKVCTTDTDISWDSAAQGNAQYFIDAYKKFMVQESKKSDW